MRVEWIHLVVTEATQHWWAVLREISLDNLVLLSSTSLRGRIVLIMNELHYLWLDNVRNWGLYEDWPMLRTNFVYLSYYLQIVAPRMIGALTCGQRNVCKKWCVILTPGMMLPGMMLPLKWHSEEMDYLWAGWVTRTHHVKMAKCIRSREAFLMIVKGADVPS